MSKKDLLIGRVLLFFSIICLAVACIGGYNLKALSVVNWVSGDYTAGTIWGYCPKDSNAVIPSQVNVLETIQISSCVSIFRPDLIAASNQVAQSTKLGLPVNDWKLYYVAFIGHVGAILFALVAIPLQKKKAVWITFISWLFCCVGFAFAILNAVAVKNLINAGKTLDKNGRFGPAVALSGFSLVATLMACGFLHMHEKKTRYYNNIWGVDSK